MSRINIKYELLENLPNVAVYSALSMDFDCGDWQEIGRVQFDKEMNKYSFTPMGALAEVEIVPPHVYGLPDKERERALQETYAKYRYGGWTGSVHRWATQMLETSGWVRDSARLKGCAPAQTSK